MEPRQAYYASLPRKRSAVGILIFKDDKILVLEPTYKPNWLVPGGVVEKFESPLAAIKRETKEEIGLEVQVISLLCADYKVGNEEIGDAVHYIFLGEIGDAEIVVDGKEIKSFSWLPVSEALKKFDHHLASRVQSAIQAIKLGKTVYCEEGEILL